MKAIFVLSLIAILTLACAAAASDVTCANLTDKQSCLEAAQTCDWIKDNSKSTCKQSVPCKDIPDENCENPIYQGICELSRPYCSINETVCSFDYNIKCDTAAGCIYKSSCDAVQGGFNCQQYSNKRQNVSCEQEQPYCMQDPDAPKNCEQSASGNSCPSNSTTPCSAPCQLNSITCSINSLCAPASPDPSNCLDENGCAFTEAIEGVSKATCAPKAGDCGSITTSEACSSSESGCEITNYNCTTSDEIIQDFCSKLGNKCTTNPSGQLYCEFGIKKKCIDLEDYCTKSTPGVCVVSNAQCIVYNIQCTNPKSGHCTSFYDETSCDAKLCTWNPAADCHNILSYMIGCHFFNYSEEFCESRKTRGCQFNEGGYCKTKESLVNCEDLITKGSCEEYAGKISNCLWTSKDSGSCVQSYNCPIISPENCLSFNNENFCKISGTCKTNYNTCVISESGKCNTAAGCYTAVDSCYPKGDWQCEKFVVPKGQLCYYQREYCINSDQVIITYNGKTKCPSSVVDPVVDCDGPCNIGGLDVCEEICDPNADEAECTKVLGCEFKEKCASKSICSSFSTFDDCNAPGTGCKGTAQCYAEKQDYIDFCTQNANDYPTSSLVQKYCQESYYCKDDPDYCDKYNSNVCSLFNNSKQCHASMKCGNPEVNYCEKKDRLNYCRSDLCDWKFTSTCENQTTNQVCNGKSDSQSSCATLSSLGCSWIQDGYCSKQTNPNPNPTPSGKNSSIRIANLIWILSLLFAL